MPRIKKAALKNRIIYTITKEYELFLKNLSESNKKSPGAVYESPLSCIKENNLFKNRIPNRLRNMKRKQKSCELEILRPQKRQNIECNETIVISDDENDNEMCGSGNQRKCRDENHTVTTESSSEVSRRFSKRLAEKEKNTSESIAINDETLKDDEIAIVWQSKGTNDSSEIIKVPEISSQDKTDNCRKENTDSNEKIANKLIIVDVKDTSDLPEFIKLPEVSVQNEDDNFLIENTDGSNKKTLNELIIIDAENTSDSPDFKKLPEISTQHKNDCRKENTDNDFEKKNKNLFYVDKKGNLKNLKKIRNMYKQFIISDYFFVDTNGSPKNLRRDTLSPKQRLPPRKRYSSQNQNDNDTNLDAPLTNQDAEKKKVDAPLKNQDTKEKKVDAPLKNQDAKEKKVDAPLKNQDAMEKKVNAPLKNQDANKKVDTPLREIVVDGMNVAFGFIPKTFSQEGLQLVLDYFVKRGHKVTIIIPQHVRKQSRQYLEEWHEKRILVFTPSRKICGKTITPYDDRFILEYADKQKAIIITSDQYRDLWEKEPKWRETIEKRLLAPTFVGDMVLFPDDPLGRSGPTLKEFLRHSD